MPNIFELGAEALAKLEAGAPDREPTSRESPECYPCDDYGLIPGGDWLTAAKPCPDCDKGRQKQVEMERDAQDLANGRALRLLRESGCSWTLHPYRKPCNGQMVVKLNNQGYTYVGDTLPEAVAAALALPVLESECMER